MIGNDNVSVASECEVSMVYNTYLNVLRINTCSREVPEDKT
jgi:hypothetical protein